MDKNTTNKNKWINKHKKHQEKEKGTAKYKKEKGRKEKKCTRQRWGGLERREEWLKADKDEKEEQRKI